MPTSERRQVIHIEVYIEPGTEPMDRTRGYVIQAFKSACRNIRDGSVAVVIRDDNDQIIGVDLSGTPSEELQDQLDDLFDKESTAGTIPVRTP